MKILVVGDWHSDIHEEAVYRAFMKLGHQVKKFSWFNYFSIDQQMSWKLISNKFQNKFLIGNLITKINRDLFECVLNYKPEMLFIYRGTHIKLETLQSIRRKLSSAPVLVGYNNDDPFSGRHPFWLWRHFLQSIPAYDLMFAYRHQNIEDFLKAGARRVELLRSWYLPWQNFPIETSQQECEKFKTDVVFIGHYEADNRLSFLEEIIRSGYKLRVFGPGWEKVEKKSHELRSLAPIVPVRGEDYNKALNNTKIALCFFSKLNRDTYTRRCFEIPASGAMLLSEFSPDIAGLFRRGVEADFFCSRTDLLDALKVYLGDENLRSRVAAAGRARVLDEGHDVVSRMKHVLSFVGCKT